MNSRKKTGLYFQRFMSGFYQINVAVSRPMEFNLKQNLHTLGKFSIQCRIQYSLDANISAESFPFLPEIFFVKDCIEEITRFVALVK